MPRGLERFVIAQEPVMPAVLAELRAGRKRTHWMWFVFPQLRGLGTSPTAMHYALASRREAADYLRHPVLGPRLIGCTALANQVTTHDALAVFGTPDDMKFRSCVTLFGALDTGETVFAAALDRYFGGVPDARTLALLGRAG